MSTLTVTTNGILGVNFPGFPNETYTIQSPDLNVWFVVANGTTGVISVFDAGSAQPEPAIVYDANNMPWLLQVDNAGVLSTLRYGEQIVLAPAVNAPVLLNGVPARGHYLTAYLAGTDSVIDTYTNGSPLTVQVSPIPLNELGLPKDPIFLVVGKAYKFKLFPPGGGTPVKEWDEVVGGIPLTMTAGTEWSTTYSAETGADIDLALIEGDVRASFPAGRRIRGVQLGVTNYYTVRQVSYDGQFTVIQVEPGGVDITADLVSLQIALVTPQTGALPARRHRGAETIVAGALTISTTKDFNLLPPSVIGLFISGYSPPGYLRCNGAAVSRTTYAVLFGKIGTLFGAGDGSTTFNVPTIANLGTFLYWIYAQG